MSHFPNAQEENYLKTLLKLGNRNIKKLNNIALAKELQLNPASVLEMVRKLAKNELVIIQPDKSLKLSAEGNRQALQIVRKHRLWEVFLVQKLGYAWNEVHQTAEQLEHIQSPDLVDRLEAFLDYPTHDPHGDPIPDKQGRIKQLRTLPLTEARLKEKYSVTSFTETADDFLTYLDKSGIELGTKLTVAEKNSYDNSLVISIGKKKLQLSDKVAVNILLQPAGR